MLGFIGAGNMAGAIIKGLIASEVKKGEDIGIYEPCAEKAKALRDTYGVKLFSSEAEAARSCGTVVLAVKPNVLSEVLAEISAEVKASDPLVISIAAGKEIAFIEENLGFEGRIARVMPNINAVVGSAVSAYCLSEKASGDETEVKAFCESFGIAVSIPEGLFSIYSAIGGCAPAFAYMFTDALATAAVKNGLPKDKALEIAAGTVLGSAKMILEGGEHPAILVDRVCSPGGTTIEGVASLKENAFESAVIKAVEASYLKDKRL